MNFKKIVLNVLVLILLFGSTYVGGNIIAQRYWPTHQDLVPRITTFCDPNTGSDVLPGNDDLMPGIKISSEERTLPTNAWVSVTHFDRRGIHEFTWQHKPYSFSWGNVTGPVFVYAREGSTGRLIFVTWAYIPACN